MISGGRVVGFLNEHKATAGAAPAVDTWECFGDIEKIEALRAAVVASGSTELLVDLVRVDRNAALGYTVLPNCVQIQLTATDVINRTITLEVVDLDGAGANYDTSPTDDGFAVAVVVSAAQQAAPATAVTNNLDQQPRGIFENLGSRAHFGVNRFSPASATEFPVLQSTIITQVVGGNQARAALSLPRMQAAMDQVHQLSGQEPDCILISPLARQQYAALFQLTAGTSAAVMNTSGEGAGKLDGGFSGLSYGGLPIKTARHVGQGGMIFMKLSSWKVLELEAHGFADLDGSVLARAGVGAAGIDAYEGYYRWYYNTVTTNPNQNAILCGFNV